MLAPIVPLQELLWHPMCLSATRTGSHQVFALAHKVFINHGVASARVEEPGSLTQVPQIVELGCHREEVQIGDSVCPIGQKGVLLQKGLHKIIKPSSNWKGEKGFI